MAGVDRRTKLIEQQVSGHPAISTCPAATAERLVAASLEPGAVVSAQIPTQLLATHTASAWGADSGRSRPPFLNDVAHHSAHYLRDDLARVGCLGTCSVDAAIG